MNLPRLTPWLLLLALGALLAFALATRDTARELGWQTSRALLGPGPTNARPSQPCPPPNDPAWRPASTQP